MIGKKREISRGAFDPAQLREGANQLEGQVGVLLPDLGTSPQRPP